MVKRLEVGDVFQGIPAMFVGKRSKLNHPTTNQEVIVVEISDVYTNDYTTRNKNRFSPITGVRQSYPNDEHDDVDHHRCHVRYVVEWSAMAGGSNFGHDTYPDANHVLARRLDHTGSYDPEGELIAFVQGDYIGGNLYTTALTGLHDPVKTMKRVVTYTFE